MYAGAGCDAAVRCLRLLAALSRAHAPAQHVPQGHAWNELTVHGRNPFRATEK